MRLLGVLVIVGCGGKPQAPRTHVPVNADKPSPEVIAPATPTMALTCDATHRDDACDARPYPLDLATDTVSSCRVQEGVLTLQLTSSTNPSASATLNFDGWNGNGVYRLDDPAVRYLKLAADTQVPTCQGALQNERKGVQAPGSGCESPACNVVVTGVDAAAASPKQVTFAVRCDTVCETNAYLVCRPPTGGKVGFDVTASCSM